MIPPSVPVDTSEAAAESVVFAAAIMRDIIVAIIAGDEPRGRTCDELEVGTGWKHQTVSARLWELERAGILVKSPEKRETRSGRMARVYRVRV